MFKSLQDQRHQSSLELETAPLEVVPKSQHRAEPRVTNGACSKPQLLPTCSHAQGCGLVGGIRPCRGRRVQSARSSALREDSLRLALETESSSLQTRNLPHLGLGLASSQTGRRRLCIADEAPQASQHCVRPRSRGREAGVYRGQVAEKLLELDGDARHWACFICSEDGLGNPGRQHFPARLCVFWVSPANEGV